MSERECVIEYLWGRILKAWSEGDDQEATSLNEFHRELEGMTDAEYEGVYELVEAGDIA